MLARLDPAVAPVFKRVLDTNVNKVAPLLQYLLKPVALLGYVLAGWRVGADMNWTGEFFISKGILSHWQVWLALAIATQATAAHLARPLDNEQDLFVP
jgi:hypothetical protein